MENFVELELPYALNSALKKMKYETPTPIQAKAIPHALEGRDILGSAQTGTGKTAAFGIPLVAHLMNNSKGSALVLCPTRELAMQVMEIMQQLLSRAKSIKTALLIGGESMGKQYAQLAARPRLYVGTPGRINDHLQNGRLMLHDTKFLVLDETDRMLDMGFEEQLEEMFRYLPQNAKRYYFPRRCLRVLSKSLRVT
jgi:Superfamily II DNA and RNA helicases